MKNTNSVCDVVIIGGGHNGLVAANYLADAKLDVIVVEANPAVGGMTATSASLAAAPHHLFSHYSVDAFFWDSFPPSWELELDKYGLQRTSIDPGHVYLHPEGGSIGFGSNVQHTVDDIRRFSEKDARAYVKFANTLDRFSSILLRLSRSNPTRIDWKALLEVGKHAYAGRSQLAEMASFLFSSITDIVGDRFEHQVVRDALHAVSGSTTANNHSATGMGFLWMSTTHRYPCQRPIGGVQAIPDALARRLAAKGGKVLTGNPVTEIQLKSGRATGVVMKDGTAISARKAVLGCCDPKTTLQKLLPAGTLSPLMEARVDNIPVNNMGYGQMKVDIAFSGRLKMSRHEKWRGDGLDLRKPSHVIGTEKGMERLFTYCAAGLVPCEGDYSLWPVIPTAMDQSQAPDGQDTIYLYSAFVPYQPQEGWDAVKDKIAQGIVNTAAIYYEGIEELEIARQVLNNDDIAAQVHATGGNITHVDMVFGRMGPQRPARGLGGYKTPVDGLFIGGAGSHPGGGITGMPGYMSAKEIIRSVK